MGSKVKCARLLLGLADRPGLAGWGGGLNAVVRRAAADGRTALHLAAQVPSPSHPTPHPLSLCPPVVIRVRVRDWDRKNVEP